MSDFSKTVQEYFTAKTGISRHNTRIIYNGIHLSDPPEMISDEKKRILRHSLGIPDNAIVVGNVSRLVADKGHSDLIVAMAHVMKQRPNCFCLIVGDGEMRDVLKQLAFQQGIDDKVIFTGYRRDVMELLQIMDIFAFTAFAEAMGLSLLEAMAMRRPVIAANAACVPEIITNAETGLLVPARAPQALAGAVEKLIRDRKYAEHLADNARVRASLFSIQNVVNKLEELYLDAAS